MGSLTNVEMETDTLRLIVLPEIGGKIASLRWLPGDLELLQAPLAPYAARDLTMGFEQSDASGFDECLPSVAACEVRTAQRVIRVPDHGDFWRLPWEATRTDDSIHLAATGVSLPLRFERTLRLEGETLHIHYQVRNVGDEPVEYAWSAHPLFTVEAGDRVVLPRSVQQVQVEGSAGRLGSKGTQHRWPQTRGASGEMLDLSLAGETEEGIGDKIFAEAPTEGWAAIERRRHGLRIEVAFDAVKTPWLGLWLCYGGWPEGSPLRQQCIAIEPCTAPVDSLAEASEAGAARKLAPGDSVEWPMRIAVRRVSLG